MHTFQTYRPLPRSSCTLHTPSVYVSLFSPPRARCSHLYQTAICQIETPSRRPPIITSNGRQASRPTGHSNDACNTPILTRMTAIKAMLTCIYSTLQASVRAFAATPIHGARWCNRSLMSLTLTLTLTPTCILPAWHIAFQALKPTISPPQGTTFLHPHRTRQPPITPKSLPCASLSTAKKHTMTKARPNTGQDAQPKWRAPSCLRATRSPSRKRREGRTVRRARCERVCESEAGFGGARR
jgi:hypothetical protein